MSLRGVNGTVYIDDSYYTDESRHIRTFTTESKIFGDTFHYCQLKKYSDAEYNEILSWCIKNFGYPGYRVESNDTIWDYLSNARMFWFADQKNQMLFVLRWS